MREASSQSVQSASEASNGFGWRYCCITRSNKWSYIGGRRAGGGEGATSSGGVTVILMVRQRAANETKETDEARNVFQGQLWVGGSSGPLVAAGTGFSETERWKS